MSTCCASASPLPPPSHSNQMHARAPCIYNERQEDRKHKRMPHGVKGNIFLFQVKAIKCIACSCTQPHLQREVRRKHKRQPLPVPSNVDNSNQMIAFTKHTLVKREAMRRGKRKLLQSKFGNQMPPVAQRYNVTEKLKKNALKILRSLRSCKPNTTKPNQRGCSYQILHKQSVTPGLRQSFPHAIVALWST